MLIDGNNVVALIVLEQKFQYVELWKSISPHQYDYFNYAYQICILIMFIF
jgi:hypothetical protein